jgi:DNA-binding winged helix-turn-helix (wHTH) protein
MPASAVLTHCPYCSRPVIVGPFQKEGILVVQPARARLGALVRQIVEQVPHRRGFLLPAVGHLMDVRGQAVGVDGQLGPLTSASMALLRALSTRPGHVVSRPDLLKITSGDGGGEHAVEVAVGRLGAALGDPRIIQTVVKHGYRLAYEPARSAFRSSADAAGTLIVVPLCYRRVMAVRKKRSISIPPELDAEIAAAAQDAGMSYSAWVAQTARKEFIIRAGLEAVSQYEDEHGRFTPDELAKADEWATRVTRPSAARRTA